MKRGELRTGWQFWGRAVSDSYLVRELQEAGCREGLTLPDEPEPMRMAGYAKINSIQTSGNQYVAALIEVRDKGQRSSIKNSHS